MASNLADINHIYYVNEVYDQGKYLQVFQKDLDEAIEAGYSLIVIRPEMMGKNTELWIRNGNLFLRFCVGTSIASVITDFCKVNLFVIIPVFLLSAITNSVYFFVWYLDPCIHYEKFTNKAILSHFDIKVNEKGPTVLFRTNIAQKKLFFKLSLLMVTVSAIQIIRLLK